ncbi:MAG TPA: phosphoenolpyruvate--protein phosphotransferase [Solirubrobacteraceae bacterium]|nr:phosphoenolpyruvate--protein phosphotransferase [Solirubrobacteraceae bacterium]
MVGLVVVSHSRELAEGVVALAREMGGEELALEAAGGLEEPGALGTDPERVRAAVERAMSDDGVLVLMDLGSALMSAEMAIELLADGGDRVRLSEAPLVEGAVAAAVSARGGGTIDEVAAEARGALAMKASQLGAEAPDAGPAPAAPSAPADAEARLEVRNAIGLHARPAARFVEIARRFEADVRVAKDGGGAPVGATSLTSVVALGARLGDALVVTASGAQAAEAVAALEALADEGFGDGVVARAPAPPAPAPEPEPARTPAAGECLRGVAASPGVAIGPARALRDAAGPPPERAADSPDDERARLDEAREAARAAVAGDREAMAGRAGEAEAAIFDAHLALLDDDALLEPARAAIAAGATAERAWFDAAEGAAERFRGLDDALLRERAADVQDVGRRVVAALTGEDGGAAPTEPGIVVARELTPADTAGLDPALVRGIATARGAATAHAAILARALGLPGAVGLGDAVLAIADGTALLLDGDAGTLIVDPPEEELAAAEERRERAAERRAAARERAHEPATTTDGERIEVFANLGSAAEASAAVEAGAEGVGLLRTEFLFLDRPELPDEDEQAATLAEIARALDGRPLVVRTLDAGADKPLPALPMPPEANPFLGVRGIRLALARPEVLATQLRAILRVAAEFPVKAMLPMVATVAELRAARAALDEARAATGIDAPLDLGIMVEVPAAALGAAALAEHADFFSIGTNDLTQYTMAAERGEERLASLLAGPQPAVLALVRATVEAARASGRWVGVCGELAGDPAAAVLLAGLGVTELSMAPALVPEAKAALRAVSLADARTAAAAALAAPDAETAREAAAALLSR